MSTYLLPRKHPLRKHLVECQWGEFVDRDSGERYKITNRKKALSLIHQCARGYDTPLAQAKSSTFSLCIPIP